MPDLTTVWLVDTVKLLAPLLNFGRFDVSATFEANFAIKSCVFCDNMSFELDYYLFIRRYESAFALDM